MHPRQPTRVFGTSLASWHPPHPASASQIALIGQPHAELRVWPADGCANAMRFRALGGKQGRPVPRRILPLPQPRGFDNPAAFRQESDVSWQGAWVWNHSEPGLSLALVELEIVKAILSIGCVIRVQECHLVAGFCIRGHLIGGVVVPKQMVQKPVYPVGVRCGESKRARLSRQGSLVPKTHGK